MTAAVLLTACGASVSYIGKSYPAVDAIDLWFDWKDVPCDYTTMGHIDASPGFMGTVEDAQAAIEQRAREVGADAVVFEGIRRDVSDPVYKTTEESKRGHRRFDHTHVDHTQGADHIAYAHGDIHKNTNVDGLGFSVTILGNASVSLRRAATRRRRWSISTNSTIRSTRARVRSSSWRATGSTRCACAACSSRTCTATTYTGSFRSSPHSGCTASARRSTYTPRRPWARYWSATRVTSPRPALRGGMAPRRYDEARAAV